MPKTLEQPKAAVKERQTYRVLVGKHVDEWGAVHVASDPKTCVFEATFNVVERFGIEKFERWEKGAALPAASADAPIAIDLSVEELNEMTSQELIKLAEEVEVDLQGKTKKEDIIALLKGNK